MVIGKLIADYRYMNRISVRALSKSIGISHATLNRVEHGAPCDGDTMIRLIGWLFSPPSMNVPSNQEGEQHG